MEIFRAVCIHYFICSLPLHKILKYSVGNVFYLEMIVHQRGQLAAMRTAWPPKDGADLCSSQAWWELALNFPFSLQTWPMQVNILLPPSCVTMKGGCSP